MSKPTGPGVIEADPKYAGPGKLKALLSNFDIDGDNPKAEHAGFIVSKVVPLLANNSGQIWMQGSASRTGTDAHNMDLSRRRVQKVAALLKQQGIFDSQMQLAAVGESMSFGPKAEDAAARAVALLVLPRKKDDPPPPAVAPSAPKVNTQFKLKMHANLNVAQRFGIDFAIFQIWDQKAGLCSFYTYWAGGASGGLIPRAWLTATLPGDWNDLGTNNPIAVNEFGGAARFSTAGGGPWTKNILNFMGLPTGTMTVPNPLPISTGFTIGIGAGTSVGVMRLEKLGTTDGLLPFTGP